MLDHIDKSIIMGNSMPDFGFNIKGHNQSDQDGWKLISNYVMSKRGSNQRLDNYVEAQQFFNREMELLKQAQNDRMKKNKFK